MSLVLDNRPLWAAQTNCYVLAAEAGGPAIIVDAPPDVDGVTSLLERHRLAGAALLLTHGHVDHLGGAGDVVERTSAAAYIHPDDEWLAADPAMQVAWFLGALPAGEFAQPERYERLSDGRVLDIAGLSLEVLHTPGHTPGHCCFYVEREGLLFSGDLLFAGSVGRWDLPGGDLPTLMASMTARVLPLPADTEVLPGHGPATTLARERRSNPFLQEPIQ